MAAVRRQLKLGTCQPIGGRKSSRKATDLGRRWQRYTAILVRQRQAVGTERCGRSWLGKLLRKCGLQTKARGRRAAHGLLQEGQACGARLIARGAGVRRTAYCKRGRRASTAYCKEGRGRARLSPRRQTLAAKAEKTIRTFFARTESAEPARASAVSVLLRRGLLTCTYCLPLCL
ncbi:BQ5605_C008g05046 [Microbotryum silenes-dioicae]|uniref:BQ5605_C008g05046 protein n=1 Tax=Microbotryum silenes-dioicae TaxID=796604 RepID=A0A2X0MBV3_9BASI|nr:BQ5605_C008g05046 [Microbotryum silenes-dioicae]